jgi:SET domain-containing protein
MRDIAAGEELTIDYALFLGDLASPWSAVAGQRPAGER